MIIERFFVAIILILPFQFALNVGANVDLVITRVLVPIIFLCWLARGLAKRKIWVVNKTETWLLLVFLFMSALSLAWGASWERGERKFLYLFSLAPIYFVAADIACNKKWKINIFRAVSISGFLAASIALAQFSLQFILGLARTVAIWQKLAKFFLGASFGELVLTNSSWLVNVSGKTIMRAFGVFPDPHVFSFFVSLCFFSALGYFSWESNKNWKNFTLVGIFLMLLSALLSFARGAYLGIIAGGVFFLIIYFKRAGSLSKFFAVCAVVAVVASIFFSGSIKNRLASAFNPQEGSNSERIQNWKQAADLIKEHPFSGVGLGNYSHAVSPLSPERSSIYAHNIFFDISAETGLINGFIFLLLIGISFFKNLFSKSILGLGLASALLYFFVHGIFDTPIYSPQVFVLLLVILALGYSPKG